MKESVAPQENQKCSPIRPRILKRKQYCKYAIDNIYTYIIDIPTTKKITFFQ